ncbi:ABC transporter permease [Haloferacaceae archaeon DSL9]
MSKERGRIRISGFNTEAVRQRDPLSNWEPALDSQPGKSRLQHAWRRFKRNRTAMFGAGIIVVMALLAIFSRPIEVMGLTIQPIALAPNHPTAINYGALSQGPSPLYPFGTDWAGRDIFSRVLYGGRWSLSIGFIAVGLALFIGIPLGAIAGYYGGWIDEIIMRIVDILYAFPFLVLAIGVVAVVGRGFWEMVLALVLVGWISYARLIRGEILSVKENEYVLAAKALGATDRSIIFRHIVPNAMAPVIVQATLGVGTIVLAAAALGFLGLGLEPASAEWGSMLSRGRDTLIQGQWWVTVFPGMAIFVFVMAINLVGDGVRDAFDPQSEGDSGGFR